MERTTHLHIKHTNDFKYYVILFSDLPNKDINEIVCIPWMWIVSHRVGDLNVVVSYPVENPSDTEKRVKEREKHSKEWKSYKSVVIFATDSYEDAKHFAAEKIKEINYSFNPCLNMKNQGHNSSAKVEETTHRSKRSADSNPKTSSLEYDISSKKYDRSALKRSKVLETAKAFNSPYENQSSPVGEKPSNSAIEPRIIASREFFTDFFTLIRDLQATSARDASVMDMLRETLIQNAETMKKVAESNVDSRASLASSTITPKASTSTAAMAEVEKISEKNNKKQKEQDDEDDDGHEVVNNKRSHKPTFVLPPEYDENNSRWTLKHRELALGLIELMPNTSVYIDADKLLLCKRFATDRRSLARMLALEIFTESALSVCSFTGSRATAYAGKAVRPGLDENARTALVIFVQEYGNERNWKPVENSAIQNTVRFKMQEMRIQYEQLNVC